MSTNVYHLPSQPAAAAGAREPLTEAVREIGVRVAALDGERRRYNSRLGELNSGDPSLRRSHSRSLPIDPHRPLTIYSIEEAAPLREARRG